MTRPARRRRGALLAAATGAALAAAVPAHAADPVTVTLGGGALTITGDDTANIVVLRLLGGDPTHLVVDVGDDGSADATLARSGFDHIDVDTAGGDDTVLVDDANGAFTDAETTSVDGGKGADTLTGGTGGETIEGGPGLDAIDAGDGADTVSGGLNRDTIDLGGGDDHATWRIGDELDAIAAGSGSDTLDVAGTDRTDRLLVGSDAIIRPTDALLLGFDGFEVVSAKLLGGADHLTSMLWSGPPLVVADLGADGQADTVEADLGDTSDRLTVAGAAGSVELAAGLLPAVDVLGVDGGLDTLLVEAAGGDDVLSAAGLAADSAGLEVRGGDGNDTVTGGDGDDVLRGGPDDDTLTGGPGTDLLDGGPGTNTLVQ